MKNNRPFASVFAGHFLRLPPAAVLAFIPLTFSIFWRSLTFTLADRTIGGAVPTFIFLPSLYAIQPATY